MSERVLVYKGEELAAYGFGDPHPFGTDRHNVFHRELAAANLADAIRYEPPRRASVDDLLRPGLLHRGSGSGSWLLCCCCPDLVGWWGVRLAGAPIVAFYCHQG